MFLMIRRNAFLFWSIILSFVYNIFWLFLAWIVLQKIESSVTLLTLAFLGVYIFIAIPLRDIVFKLWFTRRHYAARWQVLSVEKNISKINKMKDVPKFLQKLVKAWKLPGLKFIQYIPEQKMMLMNESGRFKWIAFRKPEMDEFFMSMKVYPWARNSEEYPGNIREYLEDKDVFCVVPIVYRDVILGFLGFPVKLDSFAMTAAEAVARKIGLIMENDILRTRIPRSRLIRQEFSTAKRIENYLSTDLEFRTSQYHIHTIRSGWAQKFFPALFESSARGKVFSEKDQDQDSQREIFILARLPHSSHRSAALQLFAAQGYFLAFSRSEVSFREFARLMQKCLVQSEGGSFQIEGFLVEVKKTSWKILPFGESLTVWADDKEIKLRKNPYLGHPDFRTTKFTEILNPRQLIFALRSIPLVRCNLLTVAKKESKSKEKVIA
ncbi:MAG: hypothetical protein D6767_01405 [Candidatus Hydrogenedentota bacterium]|nr:MAG: hypothetical protein D6767_01405 [Candidatus Hydrogenedentota bacterium]